MYMYPCPPVRFSNLSVTKIGFSSLKLLRLNINNVDIVGPNNCRQYFDVKPLSILWSDRVSSFENNFAQCNNSLFCQILAR